MKTRHSGPDPLVLIYAFAVAALLMLMVYFLASCCTTPVCPPPVQHTTTVVATCELPPGPGKLPKVTRVGGDAGCPARLACYDTPAAAALAERNSRMVQWIREAKTRCGASSTLDGGPPSSVDSNREDAVPP